MNARELWVGQDHRGNNWMVQRYSEKLPNLVRWVKYSGSGRGHKLLDQVSDWTGSGWNAARWIPAKPMVPDYIQRQVEELVKQGVG
jgi:hypothetical protein